jgi:hypothetical protein
VSKDYQMLFNNLRKDPLSKS